MKARRLSWQRGAAMALAAGLAFVLVGDRARAGLIPGVGIDPLEVMDLQVKPNVIIVLDSSGSMTETVLGAQTTSGDHPRSKLGQAKTVLKQVIANNDKKASFMFGQYTSDAVQVAGAHGRGADRWLYGADSLVSPSMLGQETVLDYHAFQEMLPTNNLFVFGEETAGSGSAEAICQFSIPPGFYTPGAGAGTMAQAIQDGMNTVGCVPARTTPNIYAVTWNAAQRRFDYVDIGGGVHRYHMRWAGAPVPTIRQLITANVTATPGFTANGGSYNAGRVLRLTRRDATMKFNDTVVINPGPPVVTAPATFYNLISTRFWNGQTLHVTAPPGLDVCAIDPATTPGNGTTIPWYFNVVQKTGTTCASADGPDTVKFTFFGDFVGGNGISCGGFQRDVPLIPCDQTTPTQVSTIDPFLQPQIAVTPGNSNATCGSIPCPITNYHENSTDGTYDEIAPGITGGVSAAGNTPVIQTIADVHGLQDNLPGGARPRRNFAELWFAGQAAAPGPPPVPFIAPISTHPNPKERTILLFITDGDPTCSTPTNATGVSNNLALGAAWSAEQAFRPLDMNFQASSLSTYFVAFGNGASVTRANWIAWGGSGYTSSMVASINGGVGSVTSPGGTVVSPTAPPAGPPAGQDYIRWAIAPPDKSLCPTCIDAFIAPDSATLITQLESILNQGASTGEFSAQQSVTSNVYEFSNLIAGVDQLSGAPFDPANPTTRLVGFVPTRFVSTFSVPGFLGQFRAFTDVNGDGAAELRWSAGDKLVSLVSTGRDGASGMNLCTISGTPGQCTFQDLHQNTNDGTIGTSTAAIKRRIYSTSGNGRFGLTAQDAIDLKSPGRAVLWPPGTDPASSTTVGPNSNTVPGLFDSPLGLPTGTLNAADYANLQTKFHACKGLGAGSIAVDSPLPANLHPCNPTNVSLSATRARREAREMILAFMAGAKFVPDGAGDPTRMTTGPSAGEILYVARGWLLAEGTLSTPAVVAPPIADNANEEPAPGPAVKFNDEYHVFRDGVRSAAPPINPADAVGFGLGLRNPDRDAAAPIVAGLPAPDTRQNLKPVMTVVYAGTNLMLHAFRGGPCTGSSTCSETGGEELWAFVPYDQLGKTTNRYLNDPQPRSPHDFVIAASLRFGDVFVPIGPSDPPTLVADIGGIDFNSVCDGGHCDGVWRRILYVGRGLAGKYWTALDVTGPGMYTQDSISTNPPLIYWSRGNPDTTDGKLGGPVVNGADTADYATMGQTWSLPAINFIDKTGASGGPLDVNFVLNMGSGFSDIPAEGHDFYTVDALTGDMIGRVDVDAAATSIGQGLPRATPPFPTALAANAAGFSKARFFPGIAFHPARDFTTRNYFGDVQGRLWKVLVADPNTAVPIADIGDDQPLGSPLGLFGLLGNPGSFTAASQEIDIPSLKPTIFGSSGNDNRIPLDPDDPIPQFKNFALFDNGSDTDVTPGTATAAGSGIRVFGPNTQFLFDREFDPDSNFRGTLQPTTAALDRVPAVPDGVPDGVVVFFGGTRFNPIGSPFVIDPCRSTFDSIVFAFDINTGGAAFDLQSADDTFTMFQDSRLVGIFTTYSPDTSSGGKLVLDEGLVKGTVQPPPPAGQPPGSTKTNYSVIQTIRPNSPLPGVRFGSTVCQ